MSGSRAWRCRGLAPQTHLGTHLAPLSHLHLLLGPLALLVSVGSIIRSLASQDPFPSNLTP